MLRVGSREFPISGSELGTRSRVEGHSVTVGKRERFEEGFEAWAGIVARWRYAIVALSVVATSLCAFQLPGLQIDTSIESYLTDGDPVLAAYDELREQFGRDQAMLITLEPADVFDLDFLYYLKDLHEALEEGVPHLDEITSLVNIRSVEGREDELIVGDLLDEMPASQADLDALRERVTTTPSYRDTVISRDGRITSIVILTDAYSSEGQEVDPLAMLDDGFADDSPVADDASSEPGFLTAAEDTAVVEAVKAIVDEHRRPGVEIHVAGSLMIAYEVSQSMMREIPVFFLGSLMVIAGALFVLFRRLTPCFVALLVVTMSVVSTFGFAGGLGQTMSLLTQILPSFLLAVGVGYSVHLFAIYFQHLDAGDPRDAALRRALRHSGPPIAMTALTTIAGLASFLAAAMPPMRDFGVAAILGVGWTLVLNLTLLPALICILPMRGRTGSGGAVLATRFLCWTGMTSARHPWKVVAMGLALAVASILSAVGVEVSNNPIEFLAPENPFRVAHRYIDDRFGGMATIELYLDAHEENALYEPSVMNRIQALDDYFREYENRGFLFGETTSVLDIAKETHQALNANDSGFYAVAQDRALLAQELFLFENTGNDDLERVVDPQFRQARYSVRSRFIDGNEIARQTFKIERELAPILGSEIGAVVTGAMTLIARTVEATTISLFRTYSVALAVITPLMMLLIGSLRSGLVSMVPNLLPILLTLGMMPVIGVPLDIFTLMVGCIAIGLAVDDTLHFIHGFRARLAESGDPYAAIEETLQTTGRALLFTSIVLSLGFLVLTLSSMANLRALGALTAFAISVAFVLDIVVTPALLILVTRRTAAKG